MSHLPVGRKHPWRDPFGRPAQTRKRLPGCNGGIVRRTGAHGLNRTGPQGNYHHKTPDGLKQLALSRGVRNSLRTNRGHN